MHADSAAAVSGSSWKQWAAAEQLRGGDVREVNELLR